MPVAPPVFLRDVGSEPFGNPEVEYLQAPADLASAAFRRVELLEALHESEDRFHQIAENIREFIIVLFATTNPGSRHAVPTCAGLFSARHPTRLLDAAAREERRSVGYGAPLEHRPSSFKSSLGTRLT